MYAIRSYYESIPYHLKQRSQVHPEHSQNRSCSDSIRHYLIAALFNSYAFKRNIQKIWSVMLFFERRRIIYNYPRFNKLFFIPGYALPVERYHYVNP